MADVITGNRPLACLQGDRAFGRPGDTGMSRQLHPACITALFPGAMTKTSDAPVMCGSSRVWRR